MQKEQTAKDVIEAPAAFQSLWKKLQTDLVGSWEAKIQSGGTIRATYKLVSNGTALVETYVTPSGRETITVYHPDGPFLTLTHYCAQGNQARLKATEVSADKLVYRFLDATNLNDNQAVLNELIIQLRANGFDRTDIYREPDGTLDTTILHFVRSR